MNKKPPSSARSLKDQNAPKLAAVAGLNWLLFCLFASFLSPLESGPQLLPIGIGFAAVAIVNTLNSSIGPTTKARVVYWKWNNPLPASQAFSKVSKTDSRINRTRLLKSLESIPRNPEEQNRLWYQLYLTVKDETNVLQNHKEYLFARDLASLSALFIIPLIGLSIVFFSEVQKTAIYSAILIAQYLIARTAAANAGMRFVSTVLAIKSAEE